MKSDSLLWIALKNGNKSAYEKIYRANFQYLLNYGFKMGAGQDLVEDCIQELFVEIWNRKSNLSNTDHIRKYLTVSFRRKLIRELEKSMRLKSWQDEDIKMMPQESSVEQEIFKRELLFEKSSLLKTAIDELSARQKEIIYLKFYAKMDNKEIAETMNISYQSVRNLLVKALKRLQKQFHFFLLIIGYNCFIQCLL